MSEKKMPKAQRQAWLVGQYQLALLLIEAIEKDESLPGALHEALKTIGEQARQDDMMALFFACIDARVATLRADNIRQTA